MDVRLVIIDRDSATVCPVQTPNALNVINRDALFASIIISLMLQMDVDLI
jgi:hypothetical protein